MVLALPTARADVTNLLPSFWGFYIRFPEWPTPTLAGTDLVDGTMPGLRVEEDAVAVGKFNQAAPDPNLPDVAGLERLDRHPQ